MIQVNLSADYHSQRNNLLLPLETCGATAAVMALKASGWPVPPGARGAQPEDLLTAIMMSPEGYARREAIPGTWADTIEPYRIHVVLEWAINKWIGKPVDTFTERGELQDMVWRILHRRATVVNGLFDRYDHQVAVVGFTSTQHEYEIHTPGHVDLSRITDIIIDDPYGDYRTGYSEANGNDVRLPLDEFKAITHIQGEDQKWMHLIERGPLT